MAQVLETVGRRVRGPAWSVGEMVARSIERSRNLPRIDLGTRGCDSAGLWLVVLGHPEMGNT